MRAPGKVNVYFRVGALQPDGYHDVASLYLAVSLGETVTAKPSASFSLEFTGPIDTAALPLDDTNLAMRAARMLAEHMGVDRGVSLQIEKHVPIAGGMGGGSADAAAALLACDELWGTGLGRKGLLPLAAALGADVPFALIGGAAVGTGRGDELSNALTDGKFSWVFALADGGLSAGQVYQELDRLRKEGAVRAPGTGQVQVDPLALQAVRYGDAATLAEVMHNDLQVAAMRLMPQLGEVLEYGETHGARAGIVSGSGPTLAFLIDGPEEAAQLQAALGRRGIHSLTAHGPVHGARRLERE